MTAREKFQQIAAEAHRDWRLYCISVKRDWFPEREIIKLGIGEIAAMRLQLACMPLLATLATIEEKLWRLERAWEFQNGKDHQAYAGTDC
jgi:hypothetical protein